LISETDTHFYVICEHCICIDTEKDLLKKIYAYSNLHTCS